MLSTQPPPAHVLIKTAFISDVHLGSPHSTAGQATVDFLTYIKPQTLYVLGDLFDGQEMSQNPHWTRHNEEAVQRLHHLAATGSKVIIIPGNHDLPLRHLLIAQGIDADNDKEHLLVAADGTITKNGDGHGLRLMRKAYYQNAEGLYLLAHGDESDKNDPARHHQVKMYDRLYYPLTRLTPRLNRLLARVGYPHYVRPTQLFQKLVCRHVTDFVQDYESRQAATAKTDEADGIICGHIHFPASKMIDGTHYHNCGSLQVDQTALIEGADRKLHLLDWGKVIQQLTRCRLSGRPVSSALENLARDLHVSYSCIPDTFRFQDPGQTIEGEPRTHHAQLIRLATYDRERQAYPVAPAP